MNNFYERCLQLRDFYLKTESDNTNVSILAQIFSLPFYNHKELNDLPKDVICSIYIKNLIGNIEHIEEALKVVLSDLEFTNYSVWHNKDYYITHEIYFMVND